MIQWFPGHMVKARREIETNMKLVDVVVMLLDARAPSACRNPDLERMVQRKQLVLVLNKVDLADDAATRRIVQQFKKEDWRVATMDSVHCRGAKEVLALIQAAYAPRAAAMLEKGRRIRPVRVMVVGVPNVGKSTFLNCLAGKKMARVGEKPGITRGKQWMRVRDDVELLDTPGLMWPRIDDEKQGLTLALLNIIGENAYTDSAVALYLISVLLKQAPALLKERYGIQTEGCSEETILTYIAKARGYLQKGGDPDVEKAYRLVLQEFRKGIIGRITLE